MNSFIVITLYQESHSTCRKKEHFLFRRSTSTLPEQHTSLDVLLEKQIDDYWVIHGPVRELRGNKQPQDLTMYGRKSGSICLMQRKAKQSKSGLSRNQNSTTARQVRGMYFIEPNDEEFKVTIKAARRKLEVPMPATMPCKIPIKSSGEAHRSIGKCKTKYACIVNADDSMRIRLEGVPHRYHEDHIAAKGIYSLSQHNLVHKFIPMPQALKIPDAKAAVAKEWERTGDNTGMAADTCQKQKRGDRQSQE